MTPTESYFNPHDLTGAVDLDECPRRAGGKYGCRCELCAVCGNRKHTAIHGPEMGGAPGGKPYGHAFKPEAAIAR